MGLHHSKSVCNVFVNIVTERKQPSDKRGKRGEKAKFDIKIYAVHHHKQKGKSLFITILSDF